MQPPNPWSSERQSGSDDEQGNAQQPPIVTRAYRTWAVDQNFIAALNTLEIPSITRNGTDTMDTPQFSNITEDKFANVDTHHLETVEIRPIDNANTLETISIIQDTPVVDTVDTSEVAVPDASSMENTPPPPTPEDTRLDTLEMSTSRVAVPETPLPEHTLGTYDGDVTEKLRTPRVAVPRPTKKLTQPLALQELTDDQPDTATLSQQNTIIHSHSNSQPTFLKRGTAILLMVLLSMMILRTFTLGPTHFLGSQGWASVIGGPATTGNPDLIKNLGSQLHQKTTPGASVPIRAKMTPQHYIDLIVRKMTLDQKLGQMMIVQFTGATYDLPISTMISQYNVGAVLVFSANGNIVSKDQLTGLIKQMKDTSTTIPLAVAIDQEGGTVDRLADLDGPRPAAATIGATNDPAQAKQAGIQDAQDLTSYGFNLNLAPVVDVTNMYNPQLYGRTFGGTPEVVTKMAQAYLQGLQQSGKVVGTLKHFPGLGDVTTDPHLGVPYLDRTQSDLEHIDWAPYRALIQQGNVHAIMVTHEIVAALDKTEPSSLSPKIIQGILRDDLGFTGVVMTDSLTMEALTAYASQSQAAALSVEAGADLLMGAGSPGDVASMIQGIKQAINTGALTEQRIDDSVHRILMMKYSMGLLPIPQS